MSMLVGTSDMPMQTAVFQLPCPHPQAGDSAVPHLGAGSMEEEDVATPAGHDLMENTSIPIQDDTWNEVTR